VRMAPPIPAFLLSRIYKILKPLTEKVLTSARILKETVQDQVPIIGVVMSPFSLPVMQLGFNRYIELIYESPHLFQRLMDMNTRFCVDWANAQLEAGSTAICYFDPVSSPTIIPRELYLKTGLACILFIILLPRN